jgi:hypothetical protein
MRKWSDEDTLVEKKTKNKKQKKVLLYEFTFPAVKETSIGHVTE